MVDRGRLTPIIERITAPTEEAAQLVAELEAVLAAEYPPEQRHGFPIERLFAPEIRFFVARIDGEAVGCGAVALYDGFGEVKRMYVRPHARGRAVADSIVAALEAEAVAAGLPMLRLETGIVQAAALKFYERIGFRRCSAFGDYLEMAPHTIAASVFMEKPLY
jgi:putative acetyltransferase